MNYNIQIIRTAQKYLSKIQKHDQDAIIKKIQNLATNPRPEGCKKLTGRKAWRIRIGNYRVIYEIYDRKLIILVIVIRHRRDAYK